MVTDFDRTEEFKTFCKNNHLDGIKTLLLSENYAFFFVCAVKNEDGKTEYFQVSNTAVQAGVELSDDQISKHVLIGRGFDVVPKREVLSYDMDAISEGDINEPEEDEDF